MKKLFIIGSVICASSAFVACDDNNNLPVPDPTKYDQEAFQDSNLKIALNLDQIQLDKETLGESTSLVNISEAPALRPGATISYTLDVAKTEDMANKVEMPVSFQDDALWVNNHVLDSIVKDMYGKKPQANALYTRVTGHIFENETHAIIRSNVPENFMATPVASVIESGYYIIGDNCGWKIDDVSAFNHSGKNVYEDPFFTYIGELPENCHFKIIPQSGIDLANGGDDFWSTALGCANDGDASLQGTLTNENPGAIKYAKGGFVKITLDMESYTYTMEPLDMGPYLYVPGNHQEWKPATAPQIYSEKMDFIYTGHAYLDGEYKFTSHPDWDHTNYGNGGDDNLSTDPNAGNMKADPAGFYFMTVNTSTLKYQSVLQDWGIIGDATPLGWDGETAMTYDRVANEWSITTDLAAGTFKFRANENWDYNFGETGGRLVAGGDNIPVEAGNYTIVLKLSNASANSYTITKN